MKTAEILRELFRAAENSDWIMEFDTDNNGQENESLIILTPNWSSTDLQFGVNVGESLDDFLDNFYSVYICFDPVDEADEWLDDMGGYDDALDDIGNIYEAMKKVQGSMYNLYVLFRDLYYKYYALGFAEEDDM